MDSPPAAISNHRPPRKLAALLAVLALGVVLLWLMRATLVAWLAESVLNAKGLGPADVEVVSLDSGHAALALRGSALGSIAHLDLDYGLGPGLGFKLERVRVVGAALQLAWRDGQLFPALASSDTSSPTATPAMHIELVDVRVNLRLGAALIVAAVSGQIDSAVPGNTQLDIALFAAQGRLHGSLSAATTAAGGVDGKLVVDDGELAQGAVAAKGLAGQMQLHINAQGLQQLDGQFTVQQLVSARQSLGGGSLTIAQQTGEVRALGVAFKPLHLSLHSQPDVSSGTAAFTLDGTLDAGLLAALLPALKAAAGQLEIHAHGVTPPAPTSARDWLHAGHVEAEFKAALSALDVPAYAQVAHLAATLSCRLGDERLSCTSTDGIHLTDLVLASRLAADDSALAGASSAALDPSAGAPLFALSADDHGAQLAVSGELGLHTPRLALRAPLSAHINVTNDDAANATALTGRYDVRGTLAIERPAGQPWLAPEFAFNGDYSAARDSHALLAARLLDGQLNLASQGWTANALRGSYTAADSSVVKLVIGAVRSTRTPAVLAPLSAELDARITPTEVRGSGKLRDAGKQLELSLSARHQRANGQGQASLSLQPLVLTGADQLRALAPALAQSLSDARGEISASASAQWGKDKAQSQLSLRLKDIALAAPGFKLAHLNAALELDDLAPLHSAGAQALSATFELPALKSVPLELRFSVAKQRLRLEHARAEVFGGAFVTNDGEIDIASGASRIDLGVENIDLASAFLVLNLEQLKGSGRLSGRLPLRFEGGHIAVEQGQLQSSGAGVVQIGANALTDKLQSYGKDVELAFRALSDFHYQSLVISADKALHGPGKAMFHLQGNNPAVMQGQPFNFNISLETDFDYLAALLLQLSGVTNSALGWGAGEMIKH
jgi:hypothetical protein